MKIHNLTYSGLKIVHTFWRFIQLLVHADVHYWFFFLQDFVSDSILLLVPLLFQNPLEQLQLRTVQHYATLEDSAAQRGCRVHVL